MEQYSFSFNNLSTNNIIMILPKILFKIVSYKQLVRWRRRQNSKRENWNALNYYLNSDFLTYLLPKVVCKQNRSTEGCL